MADYTFTEEDFAPKSKHDFTEEDFQPSGLPQFSSDLPLVPPTPQDTAQAQAQGSVVSPLNEGMEYAGRGLVGGFNKLFTTPGSPFNPPLEYGKVYGHLAEPLTPEEEASVPPVAAGIYRGISKATAITPELGLSLPLLALKPVQAAFALQQGLTVPGQVERAKEVLSDPNATTIEKAEAVADPLITGGFAALAGRGALAKEKPATEVAQPKETDASKVGEAEAVHGNLQPSAIEGEGQVPAEEGGEGIQPQTDEGQAVREVALTPEAVGPHPTAEQLVKMTPDEVVAWKNKHRYGMNLESSAGTTSLEIAEKLKPEDIPKLEAERDKLRADFKKEYNEALKAKDPDRLGKTLPTQLKSQTLDEIIADYHEGAANVDYVQYQRLVRELKRAPLEEKYALQQQIEPLKNKYGGKVPPRDFPKAEVPEDAAPVSKEETVLATETGQKTFKLTPDDAQEVIHKLGVLKDSPDLQEDYGITQKQADELFSKVPQKGGDLTVEPHELNAVLGEMQNHAENLRNIAEDARESGQSGQALRIHKQAAKFEKLFEGKVTPPTSFESRATPAHGLPPGVPDRGPTFPSELMEASRQLGALVRSRATLRPGVLGQFVRTKLAGIQQADKIEVGDIRNQKTVAHEIGHSLDGILFPQVNFGDSQKSLAARVGTGTGKGLASELTAVSELMRGPMTGSKGHIAYRKRATELIADFVSLYAHDPVRARQMAPKFAKGFEDALAKDKNTQDVVQGIVSGNVIPKPPDPALKKQLAGITGTPPQPGATIPNQVPAPAVLPPPVRERAAAVAGEGLVKGAVRTFAAKVERARTIADNWRKFVKSQSDRNDVGAFIEGIGNLEKPGDTIDKVRTRMTPDKERLVKDYRERTEFERQEINQYLLESEEGEYIKFLEDYLGHFYVDPKAKIQTAVGRFAKESPHAKQRKLPTLKEAVDMGLKPITQDPANTFELTARINWQVATNRKFVAGLRDIKTGTGDPVVVPKGENPGNWPTTNNPLIERVYARQTPSGLMLWKGGAAIHPDVWRSARQILEQPISGDIGKAYDAINGFTRANAFAFSLFHDLTLRSAAVGSMAKLENPLRGLFRLFEKHPLTGEREVFRSTRGLGKELLQNEEAVTDAAQHGLKFSYTDSEAYQHNARTFLERRAAAWRDVPVLGKATRLARDIQQWRQQGLWKNTHDAFKIITYHDLVSKALDKAPPGTDTSAVKEQISSFLNDAYGGQEWQTKFWLDPGTRKVLSRFFLAPDWTLSTIRSVPGLSDIASTVREQAPRIAGRESFPTPKEGMGNVRRARFWGAEVAALATATAAAQYAIYQAFGDDKKGDKPFIWDNELNQKGRIDVTPIVRKFPWHDPKDPTRQYVNLGKRPAEIVNWFTSPIEQVQSKASRPVAMIFEQVTGQEGDFKAPWKQDHESFIESLPKRAVAIGKQALPFTFMGNQFALSVPVRKGMTKYKAQQAYESVFELATDPNRIKSLLRGQAPSEGTISQMSSQITDAAKRNGVPAEEVMRHALSTVRGHHYNEFFKAFQKGDQKTMDEEARALITLGATGTGIKESLKRRMELQPMAPPEE